ncbi:MAG: hypothetical protein Q7U24_05880 [Sulfurimicrobium sp.]|nr:hypothetical protein [Sulfurimicrobium sp.]
MAACSVTRLCRCDAIAQGRVAFEKPSHLLSVGEQGPQRRRRVPLPGCSIDRPGNAVDDVMDMFQRFPDRPAERFLLTGEETQARIDFIKQLLDDGVDFRLV